MVIVFPVRVHPALPGRVVSKIACAGSVSERTAPEAAAPLLVSVIFITAWLPSAIAGSRASRFTETTAGAGVAVYVTVGVGVCVYVSVRVSVNVNVGLKVIVMENVGVTVGV